METEAIEQVADVPAAKSLSQSRVKNAKRIVSSGKMCVYFRDMPCRTPVCDMKICEKCPEGGAVCLRINFIKRMVQKILIFIIGLIVFSELF